MTEIDNGFVVYYKTDRGFKLLKSLKLKKANKKQLNTLKKLGFTLN